MLQLVLSEDGLTDPTRIEIAEESYIFIKRGDGTEIWVDWADADALNNTEREEVARWHDALIDLVKRFPLSGAQ